VWTIYVPEQLMKNDFDYRAEVAVPLTSRRKFIRAAIATGGAGMLSAELGVLSARGNADTAAQVVLPAATKDVTPFKVHVPQAALDDLKRRLASTRWPERETVGDWSEGVPLQKAQALVAYWRDEYDWRRFEVRINAFPQYRTQIDGVGIHFIHVRSPQQNALPIILTHGWPGSVVEFMEVIGPLSDPARYGGRAEDAFHVVVPSLPGFAFSMVDEESEDCLLTAGGFRSEHFSEARLRTLADSRWSAINRKRYAALKASGRLQPGGINRPPTDRTYGPRPRFQMPATLPPYIQAALRKQPAAWRYFQALAPSYRRRYVGWIETAKREETKASRLKEAIRLLAARKPLGLK
jgi:Epoxide hydrolase N terminus/Bacteriocin-protection, YdeI or OmpD-Associated